MKYLYMLTSLVALVCAVALICCGLAMVFDIKPHSVPFVALLWLSGLVCLWAGFIASNLAQEDEDLDCVTLRRY